MKKLLIFASFGILIAGNVACSGGSSASGDDKDLRAKFAKPAIDMKDVPPSQKAIVQGFLDRRDKMAAQARAHGAGN